jgi:hypothetical protein
MLSSRAYWVRWAEGGIGRSQHGEVVAGQRGAHAPGQRYHRGVTEVMRHRYKCIFSANINRKLGYNSADGTWGTKKLSRGVVDILGVCSTCKWRVRKERDIERKEESCKEILRFKDKVRKKKECKSCRS